MADMISVIETIEREIAMREAGQKVCNYLVLSEPMYRAFKEDVEKAPIDTYMVNLKSSGEIAYFEGLVVVRLDRTDYLMLVG